MCRIELWWDMPQYAKTCSMAHCPVLTVTGKVCWICKETVFWHRTLWWIKVPYNSLPFVEMTDCQSVRFKLSSSVVWILQSSDMWCHVHSLVDSYQHFRGLPASILRCYTINRKAAGSFNRLLTVHRTALLHPRGLLLQYGVWQSSDNCEF
jgi:hypothetical protein